MVDTEHCGEEEVRRACADGDGGRLAELIIERYGAGLLGFLVDRASSRSDAEEIWGRAAEKFARHAGSFAGRGSLRAWAYRVAKNALADFYGANGKRSFTGLTGNPVEAPTPTEKPPWLQTEVKQRVRELRAQLSDVDQDLLVLRIDRDFSWKEVAEYLNGGPFDNEEDLARAASNASSQFRHAKRRLKNLMEQDGLMATVGD